MQAQDITSEPGVLQHLSESFPEFWMLAVSAAAWLALFAQTLAPVHDSGVIANWRHWMLMVLAMMLPLQIHGVRSTAERSLWPRRHRAILGFLFGYLAVWALAGAVLSWTVVALSISHRIGWTLGAAIAFSIETVWLLSPWKQVAALMCHRTLPLSPDGWRADRDCLNYGWIIGYGCAVNCWPLMLVCWLSGHSLSAMVLAFVLGWTDRHAGQDTRPRVIAAAVLATAFTVFSRIL